MLEALRARAPPCTTAASACCPPGSRPPSARPPAEGCCTSPAQSAAASHSRHHSQQADGGCLASHCSIHCSCIYVVCSNCHAVSDSARVTETQIRQHVTSAIRSPSFETRLSWPLQGLQLSGRRFQCAAHRAPCSAHSRVDALRVCAKPPDIMQSHTCLQWLHLSHAWVHLDVSTVM